MSNKIIGKNYSLSFILVNGYINRLNPMHKHTFDLICLYRHLMIYKYSIVFFINIWYFTFMQSLFFLRWNYMCLGIESFFDLSIFIAVDKVKDRILYNKVWKDNRTYWDTCQYWWKRQLNTCKSLNGDINKLNQMCVSLIKTWSKVLYKRSDI
jgi:hypothetical protein